MSVAEIKPDCEADSKVVRMESMAPRSRPGLMPYGTRDSVVQM